MTSPTTETKPLEELFVEVAHTLRGANTKMIGEYGLNPTQGKMFRLFMVKRTFPVNKIAPAMKLDQDVVDDTINYMVSQGWLTRSEADGEPVATITEKGDSTVHEIGRRRRQTGIDYFSVLSDKERNEFAQILETLQAKNN
ncbi:MAG: MarR family winged helix-turn-helix transcriptional regulator [Propionibacteriaceae bacterium]|jgi:DNA-binding MarR family transcriptional regulator|nr:MarR family winged helix-turn-helix transcriptional regulator [Propionibacteriaceae bacterium]